MNTALSCVGGAGAGNDNGEIGDSVTFIATVGMATMCYFFI
ncbi:MAG: hypothetical protein ACKOXB_01300 [Flavobacteriales bacterium]